MSGAYPTTWRRPPQLIRDPFLRRAVQIGALAYLVLAVGTL